MFALTENILVHVNGSLNVYSWTYNTQGILREDLQMLRILMIVVMWKNKIKKVK